uniref:VWFD domain-containing protein n=1 Tax=Callorhinchus milii TaxID=7868 RepID=A0A4W3HI61_CALMI
MEIKTTKRQDHSNNVCSTWGNNHFKTFDGDIYQFPGTCDYNFVSDTHHILKEFSVHISRKLKDGHLMIDHITATIKDSEIKLRPQFVVVNEKIVSLPYYAPGLYIERNSQYTKLYGKPGFMLIWNEADALMVELDEKFHNRTYGLCGDYNGIPDGLQSTANDFGNLQQVHQPNRICKDVEDTPEEDNAFCEQYRESCEKLLSRKVFASCKSRLNTQRYIQACMLDMCSCNNVLDGFCLCSTVSEYSRQCAHAGGKPENWRTEKFCHMECPYNMIHKESGSPCMDTCSHLDTSSLCEDHHVDGCFCPPGTVFDDYSKSGCIPVHECKCTMKGKHYNPGSLVSSECEECVCNGGKWLCKNLPCPGVCSLEGGAHFSTFDGMKYTFHGACFYTLSKDCKTHLYTVLVEIIQCGRMETETCLNSVVLLSENKHSVTCISFFIQNMTNYTIFRPSTFHVLLETRFGLQLQIQLVPLMQVYMTLDQSHKDKTCGLCGNYNDVLYDDYKTANGLIEGTAVAFANTWKAQTKCPDKSDLLEDPCTTSFPEQYADFMCSHLTNPNGNFAECHSTIHPDEYFKKCTYDTCNCENNKDCMCAALYSYVRACASKGIVLTGWQGEICNSYTNTCPETLTYSYDMKSCGRTCLSLSEKDPTCGINHVPVDGCGCAEGLYMNKNDRCVSSHECPCRYHGTYLKPGDKCIISIKLCFFFPLLFNLLTDLFFQQYNEECRPGCICPDNLFKNEAGKCVIEDECYCSHNGTSYSPGSRIKTDRKISTCQKGIWGDSIPIPFIGKCTAYGNGHYITFDGVRYNFDGNCAYVLVQVNQSSNGTFSVVIENIPCGTTKTTCYKSIKLFLNVIQWFIDVFLLKHQGEVCGLCGNFDGNSNEFTTRGRYTVADVYEFANSWKVSPLCQDAIHGKDPCIEHPVRNVWAISICQIIMSEVFKTCHEKVDATPYFDACVHDSCSCDTGGDCMCFCTAVAAYAFACKEAGACIDWRTPDICRMYTHVQSVNEIWGKHVFYPV